ncbi:MAG: response regulator [Candidatus Rokuibacteriota bacterium]
MHATCCDGPMRVSAPLRGRTILLVEDEATVCDVWRELLEHRGARVMTAADGLEGLARLKRKRPHAILCDLGMPIMDGLEFARRLRCDPRHRRTLLIAVTGREDDRDFNDTWNAGFDGHVVKPVAAAALEALVQRLSRHPVPRMRDCA